MSTPQSEPEVFFAANARKITFQEFRWGGSIVNAAFAWLLSRLGANFPNSTDDPNIPDLGRYRVAFEQFPPEIAERFRQTLPELETLGFHDFVFHRVVDVNNSTWIYTATAAHSSGTAWVRLHNRIWTTPNPRRNHFFPMLLTRFTDGTWLWSSAGKPDLLAPKECITQFATGATASALWDRHRSRLESLSTSKSISPVHGSAAVLEAAKEHHAAVTAFHLRRGVFVAPSPEQSKAEDDRRRMLSQAANEGVRNPEILAEIEKLQTAKSGWGNAWIILVVSLVLFLGAGRSQWSWDYVLLLVPVLFVHEAGHWLAMKAFGYRNLKMFFIPFFGAAVSGVNYNVPGWKKAIVSLAGPVPGIILGMILGISGLIAGNPLLIKAALVCLLLNGFNLIPVLPLDGGWVVHTTLFCRTPVIDVAFRALAALGLLGLGLAFQDKILMFISIPSFLRLPIAYKLSKIAHSLRREGVVTLSEDAKTVPTATADEIAARVKAAIPKAGNAKTYAQFTLEIFETLNARAPGWLATGAFLLVQVGCLGASALLAVLLVIGKDGRLGGFFSAAALQPETPIECGQQDVLDRNSGNTGARTVIVAKLASLEAAAAAFGDASRSVPDGGALARVGYTLVFSHPATNDTLRKEWFARFDSLSTNTFVCASNQVSGFRLAALASSKERAQKIAEEINALSSGFGTAVPPWATDDPRSSEVRRAHKMAADTLGLLESMRFGEEAEDPEQKSLTQRLVKVSRQGDQTEADRLRSELSRLATQRFQERIKTTIQTNNGRLDGEVVALFQRLQEPGIFTNRTEYKAIQAALGRKLGTEQQPDSKPGYRFGIHHGYVQQEGLLLVFNGVAFVDTAVGAPAFLEWLCRSEVRLKKYDIQDPNGHFGGLDDDE